MTDETRTPAPFFDEQTGYLCLGDGRHNQVVLRFKWPYFYLMWKKDKREIPVRIDHLFRMLVE